MDLNRLLIWTVGAGCILTLLQLLGPKNAKWRMALPLSILGVLAICLWWRPSLAGYVSGVLFLLFLLLPAWINAAISQLLASRHYGLARGLSYPLLLLRPSRESRQLPAMIHTMHLLHSGRGDEAMRVIQKSLSTGGPLDSIARVLRTRYLGEWRAFLEWVNSQPSTANVLSDPPLLDVYLQALGETGQREELIRKYSQISASPGSLPPFILNLIRAKVAAFCGDDFIVAQLFTGPLREMPAEIKRFWTATALQVGGRREQAQADFVWLGQLRDATLSRAARRRLDVPLPSIEEQPLEPEAAPVLQQISQLAEREIQKGQVWLGPRRKRWATWTIAASLVFVFLLEIPGGTENFENLERMGAMLIPVEWNRGQHWRMVTAAFLHFGILHLAMNLLGLLVLGLRLETAWGGSLLLVTYLVSAVGSIGLAPWFIQVAHPNEAMVLVGASGGVMGLIGGLLMQAAVDLMKGRNRIALREFTLLVIIVTIQMIFDASTPNVSSEAHVLGMSIGLCCGAVWNLVWWVRSLRR